jgi:hypothetical protein
VTVVAEKRRALEAFSGRLLPGRWADVRPPTATELRATSILRIQLDEASAKIRTARCRTTRRTTAGRSGRAWSRSHPPPANRSRTRPPEPGYEPPLWTPSGRVRPRTGQNGQ